MKLVSDVPYQGYCETSADQCLAASQMAQQMQMQGVGAQAPNMFGPGVDPDKQFQTEAENLAVIDHYSVLDGVEERVLRGIRSS